MLVVEFQEKDYQVFDEILSILQNYEGTIDVSHTLGDYDYRTEGSKRDCYLNVNATKTLVNNRQVSMLDFVKKAFLLEKERQELFDLHCTVTSGRYSNFIFINRFRQAQHQAALSKTIRRII